MNKFLFHNVGQGLFYSGHLLDDEFNFVYDCGSVSKVKFLNNAIDRQLPSKTIDFVVISHLHQDHISGLKRLLANYNVKKIFLPYLGHGNKNLVKLLIAKALLTSAEDDPIEDNIEAYNYIVGLYDDNERGRNEQIIVEFIGVDGEVVRDKGIYSKKEFYAANNYWKFIMYNKRCDNSILTSLELTINVELSKYGFTDVTDFIINRGIKEIAEIYKSVFAKKWKDLNLTSTILIHYPTKEMRAFYAFNYSNYPINEYEYQSTKPITILTGDAEFDDEMLTKLNVELTKYPDAFLIFQVPHHGSKPNWNSLTIKYKYIFNHYVIPFGLGNKYHHPHKDVINELSILKTASVSMATEIALVQYYIL